MTRRFAEDEDIEITRLRVKGQSLVKIGRAVGRAQSSIQMRLIYLATRDETEIDALSTRGG